MPAKPKKPKPDPNALTKRQQEVFDALLRLMRSLQRPPTMRELQDEMGIGNIHAIHGHIKVLRRKGYLKQAGGSYQRAADVPVTDNCPYCGAKKQ